MNTIKKTTKNIAKSNRTIANRFESDEQDLFLDKKGSTVMKDIAKTNNYIAKRLSIVTDDSDILNTSTPPTDENSFVTAGNIRDIYNVPYGIVGLNGSGLIDAAQLPSYVDDAIEGYYYNGAFYSDSSHQYEIVPESGKIYIDITDPNSSKSYRWTGSTYILIGCSSFNDLEPEAIFEITVDFTDPENPEYTITCNKTPDEMTSNPLIEVVILDGETELSRNRYIATNTGDGSIIFVNVGLYVNLFYDEDTSTWSLDEYRLQQVAFTGSYNNLTDKPTIPDPQIQSDWNQTDNTALDYIKNKPDITSIENDIDDLKDGLFPSDWRTPTKDEWDYLINTRSASTVSSVSNARYTKAQVNSINGLILIPDIFTLPSGITMTNINTSSSAFDGNTYTTSQWEILENAGCIFIPTAGHMGGQRFLHPEWGQYWTSSHQILTNSFSLFFNGSTVNVSYSSKNNGGSIRLIKDNNINGLFSINDNRKCTIAKSNLQFHCLNKEWRFAQNAFDFIGEDNSNKAENYNGWIDLFGFGTSGWNSGATAYQPWSTNELNADYIDHDLTGDYANADWGIYNMKKQLHEVAFSGDYNDLNNKPSLSTVATSGDYNDLINTPVQSNGIKEFKSSWRNTSDNTLEQLFYDILYDNSVVEGDIYGGYLVCSDTQTQLGKSSRYAIIRKLNRGTYNNDRQYLIIESNNGSSRQIAYYDFYYSFIGFREDYTYNYMIIQNSGVNGVLVYSSLSNIFLDQNVYIVCGGVWELYRCCETVNRDHITLSSIQRNQIVRIEIPLNQYNQIENNVNVTITYQPIDCTLEDIETYIYMKDFIEKSIDFKLYSSSDLYTSTNYYKLNKQTFYHGEDLSSFRITEGTKKVLTPVTTTVLGAQHKFRITWDSSETGLTGTDKVNIVFLVKYIQQGNDYVNKWYHFLDLSEVSDGTATVDYTQVYQEADGCMCYAYVFITDPTAAPYYNDNKVSESKCSAFFIIE